MPRPGLKTRSLRKKKKKTPGKRNVEYYQRKKHTRSYCSLCGTRLAGVKTHRKLAKTLKKCGRKYSGTLCHRCAEKIIKTQARITAGQIARADADASAQKYLK
ncbi:MAG: 50S ribosomal protein L34e [archaeon]